MPISVTCQCGARLEIDEKFLGKDIACPDCQRLLPTKPAVAPPPLELPTNQRTSGLAILTLALAFIPVINLFAIPLGIFALKQIARKPSKLEGARFARAGIIVAGVGIFLLLALMIFPFGVDQLLRDLAFASRLDYQTTDGFFDNPEKLSLKRPKVDATDWARWISPTNLSTNIEPDPLILVNTRSDAYITCFTATDVNFDAQEEKQKKVLERFYKTELVNLLGRLRGEPLKREGTVVKAEAAANGKWEITLDLRLGGVERRFLIQYPAMEKHVLKVCVGAARRSRFDALQQDFRDTFADENVKFRP